MKKILVGAMLISPMLAFAQTPIMDTLSTVKSIVDFLIPLLLSLAVLVFFWGLVKYIMNADDEGAKEQGKNLMIWGMIALFVMVAFWAIIGFFQQSLGLSGSVSTGAAPSGFSPVPTP